MEFLISYGWIIVLAIGFIGYVFYLYKYKGKIEALKKLRETAYQLMILAEKKFGTDTGMGVDKFNFVIERLYKLLPETIVFFISEETFRGYIQMIYTQVKDLLDDGVDNNSTK